MDPLALLLGLPMVLAILALCAVGYGTDSRPGHRDDRAHRPWV